MSPFAHQRAACRLLTTVAGLLLLFCMAVTALADGIVSNASLISLQTNLANGGRITLAFDGAIIATSPLQISTNTILDATGHNVTISGGGSNRVFNVHPGVNFTNIGVTISGGRVVGASGTNGFNGITNGTSGGNGGNGLPGTSVVGAGVYNRGNSTFIGCLFVTNSVVGGNGGNGGKGGDGTFQAGNGGNGASGGTAYGAGIYNLGTLVLSNCTLAGNTVTGGSGGTGGANGSGSFGLPGNGGVGASAGGAAIYNAGIMTVTNCTFNQNTAQGGTTQTAGGPLQNNGDGPNAQPGGSAVGAAILSTGTNQLLNCTFFLNIATGGPGGNGGNTPNGFGKGGTGGAGGFAEGGGIYSGSGLTSIKNCTFASDGAIGGTNGAGGSGVFAGDAGPVGASLGASLARGTGSFTLRNSILGASTNGLLAFGAITDQGNNISADATPTFSTTNSRNHLDAKLILPIAANGGPTLTIALKTNSPAIDKIFDGSAPSFDQRNFSRNVGARPDIGAFELGSSATNFTISGNISLITGPFSGVTVNAGAGIPPAQTDSNGNFFFVVPAGTSYIVSPQPNGYFTPSSTNIALLSNDVPGLNFIASNATAKIAIGSSNGPALNLVLPTIPTGGTYRIQASTNLQSTNWVTISTNSTTSNGVIVLVVPTTNFPTRFFRAIVP